MTAIVVGKRRRAAAVSSAVLGAVLLAAPATVLAQFNYRGIPIGERAIGLGGAYTGLADDPSAAYYNPAGLMREDLNQFSGSLDLIAYGQLRVRDGLVTTVGARDFDERALRTLPAFVGARVGVGKARHGRSRRFALAYSTLQPDQDESTFSTKAEDTGAVGAARIARGYGSTYHGVSMAGATSRKLMLGGTLYLAIQEFSLTEELSVASGEAGQDGAVVDPDARVQAARVSYRTFHFVPRLGLLYYINAAWSLGVMVQTPGIPLAGNGGTRLQLSITEPPTSAEPSTFVFEEAGDLDANAPIPWEIRVGTAFEPNEHVTLTLDASAHGRGRDRNRLEGLGQVADLTVFYTNSTARRAIGNAAVGAEYRFEHVDLQGGFFTNLSAARSPPATSGEYSPSQINSFGVAFAVRYESDRFRFSTGATLLWGRGHAHGAFIDPANDTVTYQRENAISRRVVVHIAGAFRAVAKAAKNVLEEKVVEE